MRTSISFLTTTTATAPAARVPGAPQTLELLGFHRAHRDVYFVERGGPRDIVFVLHTSGEHAGRLVVARGPVPDDLVPLDEAMPDAWLLTTRVVQRRALRVLGGGPPIRKFTLALSVEPLAQSPASPLAGRTCVTAYLRARAAIDRVWLLPGGDLAIARITYLGVPSDVGHDKQTVVLTAA